MVNIKYIIITLLVLVIGITIAVYFFPSEERRVEKQFTSLSKWVSKDPDEKNLTMARKIQNIKSVFAETCKIEAPAEDFSGTYPPEEIARNAVVARSHFSKLALKFYDLEVDFLEEESAKVITTAKLTGTSTDGDLVDETHELECILQKIQDTWLFTEVEVVEVLKK